MTLTPRVRAMAAEIAQRERAEAECERSFQKLVRRLAKVVRQLEQLGESDMGLLQHQTAGRFHAATAALRALESTLKQDAYWPAENDVEDSASPYDDLTGACRELLQLRRDQPDGRSDRIGGIRDRD
jgi:hypothetical protein